MGLHLCYGDSSISIVNLRTPAVWSSWDPSAPASNDRSSNHLRSRVNEPMTHTSRHWPTSISIRRPSCTSDSSTTETERRALRKRIEAASKVVSEFGVATKCGFGRRPSEQVVTLMEILREVAAPET